MADDTLSKGTLKLDEDLDSLKQQICDLKCEDQSGIEQVKTRVKTVQTQVKQLLEEIGKLEDERVVNLENTVESLKKENVNLRDAVKSLKEREKNLEAEVEILKTQVKQLLAENGKLEGENMALEERMVNLEDTVESLKKGNVNLRDAVKSLKEGNVSLKQENVNLRDAVKSLKEGNVSLKNEVAQLKGSDDELLLGQLCWWIQSMIFKKVLPPYEYNKNVGYKLDRIKKEIGLLKNEDIEQSEQAWTKLQHELSLSERDVKILAKAMRDTQSQRNYTAHPELTQQKLFESANRMNDKGELKTSYENITKLIGLWKTLEKMA